MSDTCQTVSKVILVEDDDDDDVEVVFTSINKSHVYRNLICQKISQEIELLQAMRQQTVPNEFHQFKEQAKKLGFQCGEDVIQSAWQRIMKKYFMKLADFPNNTAPVCTVRPLQLSIGIPPPKVNASLSPHVSVTGPSSSPTPPASTAIPIALILNNSVDIENSPHQKANCFIKRPTLFGTIEKDTDDKNDNANDSADEVVSAPESRYSQIDAKSASKNIVSIDNKCSQKRKSKTDVFFSSVLDKQVLSNRGSEEPGENHNSFVSALSENNFGSVVSKQTPLKKKKVTQKYSQKCKSSSKQAVPVNSPKTVDQVIAKSHVGVKAKIVKTKQTNPTNSRKRRSTPIKVLNKDSPMNKAQLKEFKAEQKRLEYKAKRALEIKQLEKVSDRLVEVIIPKYYNKDRNGKC